ncbi:hypothetical protein ACFSVJ_02095 [Prauserella oleivorans]
MRGAPPAGIVGIGRAVAAPRERRRAPEPPAPSRAEPGGVDPALVDRVLVGLKNREW